MSAAAVSTSPAGQALPVPSVFSGPAQVEERFREFSPTQISNDNIRKSYCNAVRYFAARCQSRNIANLHQVEQMNVAAYPIVIAISPES